MRQLFAGILLLCSAAHAAADLNWYVSGRTSIASHEFTEASGSGFGTGTLINGLVDGALAESRTVDSNTIGIGMAIGRDFGALRLEGELIYRYRSDWDLASNTHSLRNVTNVFTNLSNTTLMLQAIHERALSARWQWHVGAGVGLAYLHLESELIERGLEGERPERSFSTDTTDTQFVWNVGLGASRSLGERWQLELTYRYTDYGEVRTGRWDERTARVRADHAAHELYIALQRPLGR